ncbi:polyamine deacetylase HDAC10-like isoform X1 [Eriocheir sinensis]|uniref:polyamine deacetylase HDAC10-like isoform X1 n=1 Tax=Eriocheir sinensis TaxID=95602 RepID=UPI0021C68B1E|nr:polyamine deacetylase HDAC10-like isoform X1 [Eriocheir sinensis]
MFSFQVQGEEVELTHSQEHVAFMFSFQVQGEEVELTHSQEHVAFMFSLQAQGEEELQTIQENYKSVYLHPATNVCALLSAGSLLQAEPGPAWASSVPRPPRRAGPPPRPLLLQQRGRRRQQAGMPRVLVVDQDVHLGSGIQHLFVAEPRVLYVSLHCHHHGLFLPSSEDPNYDEWGRDLAKATTLTFAATRVAWVTQRLSLRWCCPWPTSSTHSWSWSLPALMLVRGPTLRLLRESRLL